ncbi:MAG: HIT domain-containing protein [Chlorobiales bacterium]|jgi:ATP adenylyltransferase|nr:HIT domain-containing protein [Chlorobiales bacterium]
MDKMYSPWRSSYMESFKGDQPANKCPDGKSIFVDIPPEEDEERFVIYRGKTSFIIMNLYPYNCGHLMVIPYKQTPNLSDLDDETKLEIMQLISLSIDALTKVMRPHGFNMGVNMGQVAGGSVDSHIHFHVVPRWDGDTNFLPVISDTKVISNDMRRAYKELCAAVNEIIKSKASVEVGQGH